MATSTARRLVALVGAGSLVLTVQATARAGAATHTAITTPSGRTTMLIEADHALAVSGTTSPDVTAVDIDCISGTGVDALVDVLASNVPVMAGAFSTSAQVPVSGDAGPVCRLRAVPSAVDPFTSDVTAFSGPILDIDTLQTLTSGPETYNLDLVAGSHDGEMRVRSAGFCGDSALRTLAPDLGKPGVPGGCVAGLATTTATGSTGPLQVDGHPALLPYQVLTYSGSGSSLTVEVHAAADGQVTWTESAPLVRCQGTDAFPPGAGQCDTVVATGMRFTRSGTYDAGGHQLRLRDSFVSTNGSPHTVKTIYSMGWNQPPTGELGFHFPGRKAGFHAGTAGQVVSGLPQKAATFLVRSDRFSVEGDPGADTRAVTWSRPPRRLAFAAGDPTTFGLSYTLRVPAKGAVRLGFTDSESVLTSTASRLGNRAAAAMMPAPRITSPADNAVISGQRTVVKGVVTAGANGLPVSVSVNGHPASITVRSASRATYRAVFGEPLGRHTVTATARDAGGNKRSTSITVRNK